MSFNYFDIVFAVALLWSAYRGLTKGLIVMAASLLALILGIWGAIRFSDFTAGLLLEPFNIPKQYLSLVSFALTFIAIVIGIHFLARILDKLIEAVALGFLNKLLGMAFAVLKMAFIISVILVVVNAIDRRAPFIPEEHKEQSLLYEPLSKLAPGIFPYLNFDQIRHKIEDHASPEFEV